MTTAEKLEGMTDRGQFELLATSVLRKVDPDCARLIHVGINAAGETIASPVDGLCKVPDVKPSRWLYVAHTTTDAKHLKDKWLSKRPKDKGDLIKALEVADGRRKGDPDAQFKVWLTTNQAVDKPLYEAVQDVAKSGGLSVEILERSPISDFLDTTADGQYLRRLYLGIDAERLSDELLRVLCHKSVALYEQEMDLPVGGDRVARSCEPGAREWSSGLRIQFLVGESGHGKSTATCTILRTQLEHEGFALWLPAELITSGASLPIAVEDHLRRLYPSLEPGSGDQALVLASDNPPLLIAVDDVNRTNVPVRGLAKVISWVRPKAQDPQDTPAASSAVRLLVPLWPSIMAMVREDLRPATWAHVLTVERYTDEEAAKLLGRAAEAADCSLSEYDRAKLCQKLDRDPFLVGKLCKLLQPGMSVEDLVALCDDVLHEFVKRQCVVLAQRSKTLLPAEYSDALARVAEWMLENRQLNPSWAELVSVFDKQGSTLDALRDLVRDGVLCRITEKREVFQFRHDRLAGRFYVDKLGSLLDSETDSDLLTDPYFARLVGEAIAKRHQISEHRLDWLANSAPLALAEALKHLSFAPAAHAGAIIERVARWNRNEGRSADDSLVWAVSWALVETNCRDVADFDDMRTSNYIMLLAKLRNGCARSGARFMAGRGAEPAMSVRDPLRDRIIAEAKRQHHDRLVSQLRRMLTSRETPHQERRGALALVGCLQPAGFEDVLQTHISSVLEDNELFVELLWAVARCPVDDLARLMQPLMDHLASLPVYDNTNPKYPGERHGIVITLGHAFTYGITEEALSSVLRLAETTKSLEGDVSSMIEHIDDPDVVEFIARRLARGWHFARYGRIGGLGDNPPDLREMCLASRQRLEQLWTNEGEDRKLRRWSFSLCLHADPPPSLEELQKIQADSPMYEGALWRRVMLRDTTTVNELIVMIGKHYWWWNIAHYVWCEPLKQLALDTLDTLAKKISGNFCEVKADPLHSMTHTNLD